MEAIKRVFTAIHDGMNEAYYPIHQWVISRPIIVIIIMIVTILAIAVGGE